MVERKDIKINRIKYLNPEVGKLKAFVDIAVGDFVIRGLRILEGKRGLFLGMPQERSKDGRWYRIFYPRTKEAASILTEAIMEEFKKAGSG